MRGQVHEQLPLQIAFFPFLSHGHMIPTLDIARLFSARGVKTTIITTTTNAPFFTKAKAVTNNIEKGAAVIDIEVFRFPTREVGIPEGCENVELAGPELFPLFFASTEMLKEQLELYLEKVRPTCLVADMFFPWTNDCAAKLGIPRIVFHGTSYFALCAQSIVARCKPHKSVSSDEEPFVIPLLPHDVKLTRLQLPDHERQDQDTRFEKLVKLWDLMKESEPKSFGVIVNSFYELEPEYAEFYRKSLGMRAWHIGPVSLCNRTTEEKAQRGKRASIDEHECLKWLDSKKPNSVVYICFGSATHLIGAQLREIAIALEKSGLDFLWVVRHMEVCENDDESLPTGFEQRMQDNGLIIRGWAPQVLVLEHESIGSFVTHCGWNSTLEGISAGVPMVTWPKFSEQFYNEKLITEILKIGVSVGVKKWNVVPLIDEVVKSDAIERAFKEAMTGEKAKERRCRALKLKELAREAIDEHQGSSYSQLRALIDELRVFHAEAEE